MQTHAVLAGAGAFQAERARHQLVVQLLGQRVLLGLVGIDQVAEVEVAVAHVADQEVGQPGGVRLGHRVEQAVGQAADGHAGVGADRAASGLALDGGEVRVVPRCPQARALLGRDGPFEGIAAELAGDFLHRLGLFLHARGRAMELHQQHVFLAQAELAVGVDHAHGVVVDQFAARDRHAELDHLDDGAHRGLDAREGAGGGRDGLGQRVELERHFRDHAQRAFAAHHQAREVVAGAALLRARAGADDLAAGSDDLEREHVLAHGAVAHRVRARRARGAHAADGGVGARVDREEQALAPDRLVDGLARHAGLHRHREVLGVDREHVVHAAHVDADAALHREQVAFERGAHAERNHRHAELCRQLHGVGHVLRALCEHHRRRWGHLVHRLVAPVLLAHHHGGGALRAETRLQRGEKLGRDGALVDFGGQVAEGGGRVHGLVSGVGCDQPASLRPEFRSAEMLRHKARAARGAIPFRAGACVAGGPAWRWRGARSARRCHCSGRWPCRPVL